MPSEKKKKKHRRRSVITEESKEEKREFSGFSMKPGLDCISNKYKDQYMSAGFPPKICTLFVDKLNTEAKLKCHILDIGCGKGYAGEILKKMGYFRISGLDVSNALLTIAR